MNNDEKEILHIARRFVNAYLGNQIALLGNGVARKTHAEFLEVLSRTNKEKIT